MNNLSVSIAAVLEIASVCIIGISIWGIYYFFGRIFTHYWIRRELGDMPSEEEIRKLYEENNAIIEYQNHSPTDKNLPS